MSILRRTRWKDSLRGVQVVRIEGGVRLAAIPRDFLNAAPHWPGWEWKRGSDGSWILSIGELDLAEVAVNLIDYMEAGGKPNERQLALLEVFVTPDEWREAEQLVRARRIAEAAG